MRPRDGSDDSGHDLLLDSKNAKLLWLKKHFGLNVLAYSAGLDCGDNQGTAWRGFPAIPCESPWHVGRMFVAVSVY